MDILEFTRPDLVFCPLPATDAQSLLRAFAERLHGAGLVMDSEDLLRRLVDRENLGSTGIGDAVAVPHCKVDGLAKPILSLGLVAKPGIEFRAVDGIPVRLFFTVISPDQAPAEHLKVLAAVSHWVKSGPVDRMLGCRRPESLLAVLAETTQAQDVPVANR